MSIKHRASTAQRMCEMAMGLSRHCEERQRRSNPSSFAAPWIASLALAVTGRRRSLPLPLPSTSHEIEVAAFVGLQDGLVEQVRVTAPGPFRRCDRRERRAALFQFLVVDQKIDAAFGDIEP